MTRRGNCYAAAEALYHILGGKKAGWTPMVARLPWANETHWFLRKRCPNGYADWDSFHILDPSRRQFTRKQRSQLIDVYVNARPCGFLTKRPSKKARDLMRRLTWQEC